MIKTDILFTGFYGQLNTGDDAFVEVASWGAKHFWKTEDVRFLAKQDNLPIVCCPVKGYPFTFPKTYKLQDSLLLANTQCLVSAGGSTIHGQLPPSNVKYKALQHKAKNNKFRIGAIGVSIGPFTNIESEKDVQRYLKNIDFLALRDESSYLYAKSLDLPYKPINAFDLAALLPDIYKPEQKNFLKRKNIPTIGVSVCPVESIVNGDTANEIRRNRNIIELLKEIDKNVDVYFKFYVINGNSKIGDLALTKATVAQVTPKNYEIVDYTKNTENVWKSIAACDFVLSTRLHASIFACFGNTPFMLNEYHKKCTDFLDTIGYEAEYRLFDAEFDVKLKATQIAEIITKPDKYIAPKHTEEMKERARLNFTKIKF